MDNIKEIVAKEILKIKDPIILNGLGQILIKPFKHLRTWDYSTTNEKFSCWSIALDSGTDTSLIYCDKGFGPKTPWGLVSTKNLYFGMDSAWFNNLEECYLDSFAGGELPIWGVERHNEDNTKEIIVSDLIADKAFEIIESLRKKQVAEKYYIVHRKQN